MILLLMFIPDIQEFYELTLLDDTKSVQEKTAETIRIATKWEGSDGPIGILNSMQVSKTLKMSNRKNIAAQTAIIPKY